MNVGESEQLRGFLKRNASDPCQNLSPPQRPSCLAGLVASLQRGAVFSLAATQPKTARDGWRARQTPSGGAKSPTNNNLVSSLSSYIAVYSCQDVCTHERLWPPTAVPSTYCSPRATDELPGPTDACWWHGSDGGRGPQPTCSICSATCITACSAGSECNKKSRPFLQGTSICSRSLRNLINPSLGSTGAFYPKVEITKSNKWYCIVILYSNIIIRDCHLSL